MCGNRPNLWPLLAALLFFSAGHARARAIREGHVGLRHAATGEVEADLWVIRTSETDPSRKWIGSKARKRLEHFLRDVPTGATTHVPEKLLMRLYLIGQHFDAPIEILTGLRPGDPEEDRHRHGAAVDFRVVGVDAKAVWTYAQRFDDSGVGLDAEAGFVHLDLRSEQVAWTAGRRFRCRDAVQTLLPELAAVRARAARRAKADAKAAKALAAKLAKAEAKAARAEKKRAAKLAKAEKKKAAQARRKAKAEKARLAKAERKRAARARRKAKAEKARLAKAERRSKRVSKRRRGRKKRRIRRYHMTIRHVNTKEEVDDLWVVRHDKKNRHKQWVGKRARKRLEHFLRDIRRDRTRRVPERLLWQLYLVAQHFDAPIEIVSGYRSRERRTSRHRHGKAVDFRVEGVDPRTVWTYCKRFKRVGLGYYPTSRFVHMDVRARSAYWIDDSGPGQKARYRSGVAQPKDDRRKKGRRAGNKKRRGRAHRARASRDPRRTIRG